MSDLALETITWKGSRPSANVSALHDIGRWWRIPMSPGAALGVNGPSDAAKLARFSNDFLSALREGLQLSREMVAADETEPPNVKVWDRAIESIASFIGRVPAPLVIPLQQGGLSIEWHSEGLNIELRFRESLDPYVLIDDARGEECQWRGRDQALRFAKKALCRLASRCA